MKPTITILTHILTYISFISISHQSIHLPITTIGGPASSLHLVSVSVGTPPQTLRLLADTGSDATWLFCNRNNTSSSSSFHHSLSSTFKFLNKTYTYEYADNSSTSGIWATDTITIDSDTEIRDVAIGCSDEKLTNFSDADGVLALSPNYPSFVSQVRARKFSFALANEGSLVIGESSNRTDFSYVELAPRNESYYVNVRSVFINGVELEINKEVVIDTGTTASYFEEGAYRVIHRYFKENVSDTDTDTDTEICFVSDTEVLPRVGVGFEGGAKMECAEEEVYYRDGEGRRCLAVWPVREGEGSVIGSAAMKGYFWEFDLGKRRIGFSPD